MEKVTVNALGVVDAAGLQHISKSAASVQRTPIKPMQLRQLTLVHDAQMFTKDSQGP